MLKVEKSWQITILHHVPASIDFKFVKEPAAESASGAAARYPV